PPRYARHGHASEALPPQGKVRCLPTRCRSRNECLSSSTFPLAWPRKRGHATRPIVPAPPLFKVTPNLLVMRVMATQARPCHPAMPLTGCALRRRPGVGGLLEDLGLGLGLQLGDGG